MSYERALKELAPCGIDCSRCAAFGQGPVVKLSNELKASLENFEHMAKKMEDVMPILKEYDSFMRVLTLFSEGDCAGCRYGNANYPDCAAKDCYKEEAVDFCFQCSQYPCERNGYNDLEHSNWRRSNDYMKEKGVADYYETQKNKPRYRAE